MKKEERSVAFALNPRPPAAMDRRMALKAGISTPALAVLPQSLGSAAWALEPNEPPYLDAAPRRGSGIMSVSAAGTPASRVLWLDSPWPA